MLRALPIGWYLLALLALVAGNAYVYRNIFEPQALTVTTLQAGKGDATLIKTPSGAIILVDTGSDASILRALGTKLPEWKRSIDLVVLTGTKSKTTGGLPSVESRYKILNKISVVQSLRLTLSDTHSIDILVSPNATTTVAINPISK